MDSSDTDAWKRKDAHLDLAKRADTQTPLANHPLDAIELPHCALPELNLADIRLHTEFLKKRLSMPLLITGMTGGTDRADGINLALAEIAEAEGLALGVGSQRAGLAIGRSQRQMRALMPTTPLIGNLGGVQLAKPTGLDLAKRAIDDLEADALAIHLNPLQEAAQAEGETDWRGILAAIEALISTSPVPIMIKEVGAGLTAKISRQLAAIGVQILDIAGKGGTNWARIEASRPEVADPHTQSYLAPFLDWGHTTADLLPSTRKACPDCWVIGSGGVRHGLDIARLLYLGADMAGMAGPILKALESDDLSLNKTAAADQIALWRDQLRLALFLTGNRSIKQISINIST